MFVTYVRTASWGAAILGGVALMLAGTVVVSSGGVTSAAIAAAAPRKNAISVVTPGKTIRAKRAFLAEAYARFDPRTHRPPDYLKAALYYRRGTSACPLRLPQSSRVWHEAARTDYQPGDSPRVQFGSPVTLAARGSHRFCAYVYVERAGSRITSPSTFVVKARASKVLVVR